MDGDGVKIKTASAKMFFVTVCAVR